MMDKYLPLRLGEGNADDKEFKILDKNGEYLFSIPDQSLAITVVLATNSDSAIRSAIGSALAALKTAAMPGDVCDSRQSDKQEAAILEIMGAIKAEARSA